MFVGRASRREATFTVTAKYIQALHKRPRNSATFQIEVTKLSVTELSNVSVFESDFHFFFDEMNVVGMIFPSSK